MSKDFRHQKSDWDNDEWRPDGAEKFAGSGKSDSDVNRRKRASKRLSRERSKKDEFH